MYNIDINPEIYKYIHNMHHGWEPTFEWGRATLPPKHSYPGSQEEHVECTRILLRLSVSALSDSLRPQSCENNSKKLKNVYLSSTLVNR